MWVQAGQEGRVTRSGLFRSCRRTVGGEPFGRLRVRMPWLATSNYSFRKRAKSRGTGWVPIGRQCREGKILRVLGRETAQKGDKPLHIRTFWEALFEAGQIQNPPRDVARTWKKFRNPVISGRLACMGGWLTGRQCGRSGHFTLQNEVHTGNSSSQQVRKPKPKR